MLCLTGFELYSRWVPLLNGKNTHKYFNHFKYGNSLHKAIMLLLISIKAMP